MVIVKCLYLNVNTKKITYMHTVEEKTIELWYNTGVIFCHIYFSVLEKIEPTCILKADSLQQARL